jgi:ATP-dependent DNA ligase
MEAEWTDDEQMRQTVFLGWRDDEDPREVVKETPSRIAR